MRKVKEVLAELAATKKRAETDLNEVNYKVRAGFAASIEEAKVKLPELRNELRGATVPGRLVGVFAEGDSEAISKTVSFLQSAASGAIVLDAAALYRRFTDAITPSFGEDRIFRVTQYSLLMSEYASKGSDLGYYSIPRPTYVEAVCPDFETTLAHVRSQVRSAMGDELNVRVLSEDIVDAVLAGDMDARRIPVLVLGATREEKQGLAPLFVKSTTFRFDAEFEPTKDAVLQIFKSFN